MAATAVQVAQRTRRHEGADDAALVAAVRAGDDEAFAQLYGRYQRRIAAYILGMVHDHGRAEDVVQEVFISALRRLRATDRPVVFKPWIYEIAKNACIDQYRRRARTQEVSFDAGDGLGPADLRHLQTGRTPDAAVDDKEALIRLRCALGGLSDVHHEVLVLREFEGLTYAEIGDRLGMTHGAVESTLFRARRRLAEEYEELSSGERCRRVQAIIVAAAGRAVGARDRRRLTLHVSHCGPCRRQARAAGVEVIGARRGPRARLAALLPFPLPLLLRRRGGADAEAGVSLAAPHAPVVTQLSGVALDPAAAGWGRAAAAVASVVLAGFGAGSVVDHDVEATPVPPAVAGVASTAAGPTVAVADPRAAAASATAAPTAVTRAVTPAAIPDPPPADAAAEVVPQSQEAVPAAVDPRPRLPVGLGAVPDAALGPPEPAGARLPDLPSPGGVVPVAPVPAVPEDPAAEVLEVATDTVRDAVGTVDAVVGGPPGR